MAARPATDGEGVDASVPWWRRKRPRLLPPPPPEADAEQVKAEALALMAAHPVLPRLVVFDLDHTLWPFHDRLPKDEPPYLYPQARGILKALKDRGIEMAIASRASRKKGVAKAFLEKLGIHFMFGAQTRKLGVSCVLVDTGITLEKLRTGLSNYANRSASPNAEPAGGRSAEITWYLDVATG
uniref:Magnesium-dependent phosphatase-1 n=1 Tax=Oryza barthii TaxID=65489 RepID=A0A0D3HLA5_9ORYZ